MDGIIVINKPKGCSSHDIVRKIKKITGNKAGHIGTLDPNATGVLPVLVGKGTLCSKYLINHDKTYEATLELGIKTDTADIEGYVIEKKEVDKKCIDESYVCETLENFKGKQKQLPPAYSAIKVGGKKLYEYARKGEIIEVEPRNIEIYSIKLMKICAEKKEIKFGVNCSKGTYIRTLCEDIANALGTVGYMKELNRTKVGEFDLKDAITIEEFEANYNNQDFIDKHFISIEKLFRENSSVTLNDNKIRLLLNGVCLSVANSDGVYKIYDETQNFIGIGIVQDNELKRDIIVTK